MEVNFSTGIIIVQVQKSCLVKDVNDILEVGERKPEDESFRNPCYQKNKVQVKS